MIFPDTVAVIGLGLMGGSLAKDLSAAGVRVLGYDSRSGVAVDALADGSLAGVLDESLADVALADIIVVATPVDAASDILRRLPPLLKKGGVVTDVCSTKARLVAVAEGAGLGQIFVGSHPLAGDHRSGWSAARPHLYRHAVVYISPTEHSSPSAVALVEALWTGVGASCSRIAADEHDRLMSWISHLPQVVSSGVAASLEAAGCSPSQLGPGGRDVTRLAASSPEMWTAIALTNEAPLRAAVADVRQRLEFFENALLRGDAEAIKSFFRTANEWAGQRAPGDA